MVLIQKYKILYILKWPIEILLVKFIKKFIESQLIIYNLEPHLNSSCFCVISSIEFSLGVSILPSFLTILPGSKRKVTKYPVASMIFNLSRNGLNKKNPKIYNDHKIPSTRCFINDLYFNLLIIFDYHLCRSLSLSSSRSLYKQFNLSLSLTSVCLHEVIDLSACVAVDEF